MDPGEVIVCFAYGLPFPFVLVIVVTICHNAIQEARLMAPPILFLDGSRAHFGQRLLKTVALDPIGTPLNTAPPIGVLFDSLAQKIEGPGLPGGSIIYQGHPSSKKDTYGSALLRPVCGLVPFHLRGFHLGYPFLTHTHFSQCGVP